MAGKMHGIQTKSFARNHNTVQNIICKSNAKLKKALKR